jgi:Tol biopolymer transport system component/tRNA A-37 threonylcarbamoyl transferase component Bud32
MTFNPGDRHGPYEILSSIGAGGMGKVYKARDTRLNRTVAIKVAGEKFTDRFQREAQAVAALNHPNICTLHDVGPDYLVMEFIEGQPLKGPLAPAEALKRAIEIAGAIDHAHSKGIVHRDLKPGNIMATKNGAKVLDFGLAKLQQHGNSTSPDEVATLTEALTQQGAIIGTLQYMAPEQFEGKPADTRTDIFAFGLVLYELLTGKRAFEASSRASLIAAVMSREPEPIATTVPSAPPALQRVIDRCLAKDPDDRWQSARDLKSELEWIAGTSHTSQHAFAGTPAATLQDRASGKPLKIAAAAAGLAALVFAAAWWRERASRPVPELVEFTFAAENIVWHPAISPDGRYVVLAGGAGREGLFLRSLDSSRVTPIPGTEGGFNPCWSPDSKWVAFGRTGAVWKAPVPGGNSVEVAALSAPLSSCAWSSDGAILVQHSEVIHKGAAAGGTFAPLTKLDDGQTNHRNPVFIEGGPRFLFHTGHANSAKRGIYLASLENPKGELVMPTDSNAVYVPGPGGRGFLVYAQGQSLMAREFDPDSGKLAGEPFTALSDFRTLTGTGEYGVLASLSASQSGSLAVRSAMPVETRLLLVDADGTELAELARPGRWRNPQFSSDGRRLAVTGEDGNYISELSAKPIYKFSNGMHPTWSPDGKNIAFSQSKGSGLRIFQKPADGSAEETALWDAGAPMYAHDWSRDGRYLLFAAAGPLREMAMPMGGTKHSGDGTNLVKADGSVWAAFAPNNRLLAWCTQSKGRWEIFVRGFRGDAPGGLTGTEFQISTEGGIEPRWRGDSREIYFVSVDRKKLMAVEVNSETGQPASAPRALFGVDLTSTALDRNGFDVSPDGKRFAICVRAPDQEKPPVTVLLNWSAHAGRRQ